MHETRESRPLRHLRHAVRLAVAAVCTRGLRWALRFDPHPGPAAAPGPAPERAYYDIRRCDHCGRDTPHRCVDPLHERDATVPTQTCAVCRWWRAGSNHWYHPPLGES